MKIDYTVLILIWISLVFSGVSQEIKLPEERITGEDIRIEKTRIFHTDFPSFSITFPEIRFPGEKSAGREDYKTGEGYLSFSFGSNTTLENVLYYHSSYDEGEYCFNVEGLLSGGYRDNSERKKIGFDFQKTSFQNRFSFGISSGDMELPGPEDAPFSDIERQFFSFHTGYTFTKNPYITPSISQRFYRIDNSDEINFTTLNLSVDEYPVTFETGIERYDVFNEDFSSTSFYQSIYITKNNLSLGGTIKAIERHGVRFLPSLTYNINESIILKLAGRYRIPDLYKDIISEEYKELTDHNFIPEEEYYLSFSFHKNFKDGNIYLDISPSYRDNFYGWADMDGNGLFQPYPQQYWQTSINLGFQYALTDYLKWFFKGEKRLLSEEIDYYPEEVFDTGLLLKYKNFLFNTYLSYTGERRFSDKKLGSVPVINTEIVFQEEILEWGIMVYNVADREYSIVPGYPAEGRKVMSFIRIFF